MDNKDLIKKDLAMILKLDAQIDYSRKGVVEKYYKDIAEKNLLTTPHGKRYVKRLEQIINGDTTNDKCVFCNSQTHGDTAICPSCMAKLKPPTAVYCRSCGSKMPADSASCPACGKGKDEGYKYCAHCGKEVPMPNMEALADNVKNKSKELAEQAAKITREKLQANPEVTKAIKKLQTNPDVAKTMAKGKKQAGKVRGKWRSLSRKKKIAVIAVCVMLLLMGIGGVGGSSGGASGIGSAGGIGSVGGIFGGDKVKSEEDAIKLAKKLYPETEGYRIVGDVHTESAPSRPLYFLFMQVGENFDDLEARTNAIARFKENKKSFSAYYMGIVLYDSNPSLYTIWIGEDGRVIEQRDGGLYTRIR